MTTLRVGDVLRVVEKGLLPGELHRVLWIRRDSDDQLAFVTTIEIPVREDGEPSAGYFKGPDRCSLRAVEDALDAGQLVVTTLILPPIVYMSDEEIRRRYPTRTAPTKRKARVDCAALQTRDRAYNLIEPIIAEIAANPAAAYETDFLAALKSERVKATGEGANRIFSALHRYLALAAGKNGLLPSFPRSGAQGRSRAPKLRHRLGRPATGQDREDGLPPGIHLSETDKQRIAAWWLKCATRNLSEKEAYISAMGFWWARGTKLVDGRALPVLLDPAERPTRRQFAYWGRKGNAPETAFKLHLSASAWNQSYRAKLGGSFDGMYGVGHIGIMDATPIDVVLVSIVNVLQAIGSCHRLVLHEGLSDVICGIYCGLEAPSAHTAKLTVLNGAMDKVEFCRRFGVTVTADQFPSIHFRKYRVDNGEARAAEMISTMTAVDSLIEFVESYRAERKGMNETGHHSIHRVLDHRIDGTNNGRQMKRGEESPAVAACWTWFDYMRQLIKAIVHFNCVLDATAIMRRHPFRTEMARDGVAMNRAAIYKWCVDNNRIASPPCDLKLLRAHLLPLMPAVVKQNGVFLLRPDRKDKRELVYGARFSGKRMMDLGWHSGTEPTRTIDVRCDVNDLSQVWYADDQGLHPLDNLSTDALVKREGTLWDYLAIQDGERARSDLQRAEVEQSLSDFVVDREQSNAARRREKKAAIASEGRKVSKKELKAGIEESRGAETRRIAALIDPILRAPVALAAVNPADARASEAAEPHRSPSDVPDQPSADALALAAYRRQRAAQ